MKFSVGDRVLLKRTGEEGFIVSFISAQLMEVEVAGIRFPVYADEVDHPYLKWFTDPVARKASKAVPAEPPAPEKHPPRRLPQGIYLSFLPQFDPQTQEDIITGFRIHLINETPDAIRFRYDMREVSGALLFTHQAELHPFGNVYLHPVSLEVMNAQPRMNWSLGAAATPGLPFDGVLRIRPAQLVRYIREMLEGSQPAFSIMLRNDVEQQGAKSGQALPVMQGRAGRDADGHVLHTAADAVLDLHIDPRNAAFSGLDASALLEYQLRLFEKKLSAAIAAGLHEMVIIHGVGSGTLRDALHQRLTEIAEVRAFRNDWSPQYGWGATRLSF
jgi:hypothetical protein